MSNKTEKKSGIKKIWPSLLLTALGIALILWRSASVAAIVRLIGIALIVIGAVGIIQQVVSKDEKKFSAIGRILGGALFAGVGIWVLINPALFESILKYVIAVIIILFALKDLWSAIHNKKHWVFIALPCLALILGILIAVYSFEAFGAFALCAGIALAYTGIASLIGELKK